jgi:predicted ATPase
VLGLVGSHRTGKTTLAQAFAQKFELPFVRTSATEVFAAIGRDPKVDYPIEERISIQEAILYAFEKQYEQARSVSKVFIADRTPIDLASYLLADIQRGTTAPIPGLSDMVTGYVDRCMNSASTWFSTIILVQPGIPLVEADGKAPACPAYIEHLNALQMGLLQDPKLHSRHYCIPRKFTNLEERISALSHAVSHAAEAAKEFTLAREKMGIYTH